MQSSICHLLICVFHTILINHCRRKYFYNTHLFSDPTETYLVIQMFKKSIHSSSPHGCAVYRCSGTGGDGPDHGVCSGGHCTLARGDRQGSHQARICGGCSQYPLSCYQRGDVLDLYCNWANVGCGFNFAMLTVWDFSTIAIGIHLFNIKLKPIIKAKICENETTANDDLIYNHKLLYLQN